MHSKKEDGHTPQTANSAYSMRCMVGKIHRTHLLLYSVHERSFRHHARHGSGWLDVIDLALTLNSFGLKTERKFFEASIVWRFAKWHWSGMMVKILGLNHTRDPSVLPPKNGLRQRLTTPGLVILICLKQKQFGGKEKLN